MSETDSKFQKGDRFYTSLAKLIGCGYIRNYYKNGYLTLELTPIDQRLKGVVIGYSGTGKVAVQFDQKIWRVGGYICEHNNGCHGKGDTNYCMYIPEEFLNPYPVKVSKIPSSSPAPLSALESPTERRNQLLLLL